MFIFKPGESMLCAGTNTPLNINYSQKKGTTTVLVITKHVRRWKKRKAHPIPYNSNPKKGEAI